MTSDATERIALDLPSELAKLELSDAVNRRLHALLDRQDRGEALSAEERAEAEGLVDLAELLSLLRLKAESRTSQAPEAT